jgi:hypothetical protein
MAAKLIALAVILVLYCSVAVDALPWNGGIWKQKMTLFFNQYDLNLNKVHDLEDMTKLVDAFAPKGIVAQGLMNITIYAMWTALYINKPVAAPLLPYNAQALIQCLSGVLLAGMTADVVVFSPDYFKVLDTDNNLYLDNAEWTFYFTTAQNMPASIVQPSFAMFDTDHDTKVILTEFNTGIMNYYTTSDPNNPYNTFLGPVDVTQN